MGNLYSEFLIFFGILIVVKRWIWLERKVKKNVKKFLFEGILMELKNCVKKRKFLLVRKILGEIIKLFLVVLSVSGLNYLLI